MILYLSFLIIGGIIIVSILLCLIVVAIEYYVEKRHQGSRNYRGTSNADPSYVIRTVPGEAFATSELNQGFVIIGRSQNGADEEKRPLITNQPPMDPEGMDAKLCSDDLSQSSLYGESSGASSSRPSQVFFSLDYDEKLNIITVFIDQARFLRPSNNSGSCDPYCVVSLLPSKHSEKQSQVRRNTADPIFKESFSFELPRSEVMESSVQIKFFDNKKLSRDESLGIVVQRLDEIDLTSKVNLWRRLPPISSEQITETAGELLLKLDYFPSVEKLTVVLHEVRALREFGLEGGNKAPDPYIRVSIFHEENLLKKKKSVTKTETWNPTYNQAINFAVPSHLLPQVNIRFDVVHQPRKRDPSEI